MYFYNLNKEKDNIFILKIFLLNIYMSIIVYVLLYVFIYYVNVV